jgi:hypothetical protein
MVSCLTAGIGEKYSNDTFKKVNAESHKTYTQLFNCVAGKPQEKEGLVSSTERNMVNTFNYLFGKSANE